MDYSIMSETDVREVIVRPFIESLGYKFGTEAHIRTEVTLRYSKAYLGRKNPGKDRALEGRADYICEVVPYGRWVVEVKSPKSDLTIDDSEQAHTYATHPEIGAFFYLITNGKEWRLHRIGEVQKAILSWENDQTANILLVIENILGPSAFRNRAKHYEVDLAKPLARNLASTAEIKGGFATYSQSKSSDPRVNVALQKMNGLRAPVTGGSVYRLETGMIEASIKMLSMHAGGDAMLKGNENGNLTFRSNDEFISTDRSSPTIFTNLVQIEYPEGSEIPAFLGNPALRMPFNLSMAAFTQAVGFIEDDKFKGTFEVSYLYEAIVPADANYQTRMFANLFTNQKLSTIGDFDLSII